MDGNTDRSSSLERQQRPRASIWKRQANRYAGILAGGSGGALVSYLLPAGVYSAIWVALSICAGAWLARSRQVGRQLDRGNFYAYTGRLEAVIRKRHGTFRAEYAQAQLGYLAMRRGDLAEAANRFRKVVELRQTPYLVTYARIMSAACDSLRGIESDVALDEEPPRGAEIGYCILAFRRGERDRALAIKWRIPISARIVFGARRLRHESRILPLLQAAIRGDANELSPKKRKHMLAAYPGEFDYVADHWPEVRVLIETLSLYQPEISQARLRR